MIDISDLELLKKLAGIEDTTRDETLQFLIDGAWATASKYTGLVLNNEQTLEDYLINVSGDCYSSQNIPVCSLQLWRPPQGIFPLIACEDLEIDGIMINADSYYVSNGCLFLKDGSFAYEYGKNIATITYGLNADEVPDDLRNAVIQLALIRNARLGHLDLKSKTGISKETDTYWETELTPAIKEVFELYRVRFYD